MENALVIAEHKGGKVSEQTLKTLAKAQAVLENRDVRLSTVILGHEIEQLAGELCSYAEEVFYVDHDRLRLYNNELYGALIIDLVKKLKAKLVLMGQTALGLDLMPWLSAKLHLPLITDCIDIVLETDELVASRYAYEGRVTAKISSKCFPGCLLTVASNLKPQARTQPGALIELNLLCEREFKCRTIELLEPNKNDVDITKADVVIGVGLGIASQENVQLAEDLATVLGGVVGCTRPIVDKNWLPQTRQIGFSGKTIKPRLYIAIGLSGSTHHVKGIEDAQTIIAINKDPGAPIFNLAKYAVLADLLKVIPMLIDKLRAV